jgi:hypothetical protein
MTRECHVQFCKRLRLCKSLGLPRVMGVISHRCCAAATGPLAMGRCLEERGNLSAPLTHPPECPQIM